MLVEEAWEIASEEACRLAHNEAIEAAAKMVETMAIRESAAWLSVRPGNYKGDPWLEFCACAGGAHEVCGTHDFAPEAAAAIRAMKKS